ncbi:DNA internalization-related competence protein ComEC/Rec2 [Sulfurirhabdus autotrophica]|uniref:Competence protein ComEC n=1 Tax=Sulfurirhabdus autotrophica TaxID=1706046 RepID=A0A4V2W331_9PROT|nr:DNA internalization-related competence protein ComEC/Rec2 [Sulfurirhabdus autotrophica]TCV90399.1 competence protein ComEC [Sulfurirhabdus autotrophica]
MRINIFSFVSGVWLLQQQPFLPAFSWNWLFLAIPLVVWAIIPASTKYTLVIRLLLINTFFLGLGYLFAAEMAHHRLAETLPQAWEGKDIQIVGVVAALPQLSQSGTRFEFDVEQVITPGAMVPSHIQLSWYSGDFHKPVENPVTKVHAGERWVLTVRLKRPHGNVNPYGFDYEAWLLERNIRATGSIRNNAENQRLQAFIPRPSYLVESLREYIAQRLQQGLGDRPYAGVLEALAIGEQSAVPQSQWLVFLRTGVNHLMSISGLHVTMISGLFLSLTYWLWRRNHRLVLWLPARKAALLVGVVAALSYALIAGFAVPAQRTFYMLAIVAAALWAGRITSVSVVLSLALLVVSLLDPWAVLSPGFWLSFGAVAVILYVSVGRIGKPHWFREAITTQWAVTLGLVPALLVLFQQVSIISPIANAFAIPVVSLIVVPLTLAGIIPGFGFLLILAHTVMDWCMQGLMYLSALPDAVWQQHAPVAWTAPVAMFGILWLLLPRGFPGRWLGAISLLPVFLILAPAPKGDALWLTILDVGQGLSVVAKTEHHALLYDTGPGFTEESDSGNRVILPYLRGAGIRNLDGLIVTHNDLDHSGGAISVLDGIPVEWMASSLPLDSPILKHASQSKRCYAGQSWQWDGIFFEMLYPTSESYLNDTLKDNDRSCVLKIVTPYGSVLLTGDIERGAEQELLDRAPQSLKSTILLAPHHGSKTSSTEEFIAKVAPDDVVFTVGYRNRYGHPKQQIIERYNLLGSKLIRSDLGGAIEYKFEKNLNLISSEYRQEHHRYWWD